MPQERSVYAVESLFIVNETAIKFFTRIDNFRNNSIYQKYALYSGLAFLKTDSLSFSSYHLDSLFNKTCE